MDWHRSRVFRSVLFVKRGREGDDVAFEQAIRTCERSGARLTVASVVAAPPPGLVELLSSSGASTESLTIGSDREELEAFVESARQRNVETTARILRGDAAIEIIRLVLREQHDLLVKVAESTQGIREVLFGHLDRQLIRKCPCPVLIEKPTSAARHARVLAAVDPRPFLDQAEPDSDREELNRQILEVAISLAKSEEAELHVVHAWLFDLEGVLEARAGLSAEAVAEVARSVRLSHDRALGALLAPYRDDVSQVHLLRGKPWEAIPQTAVRHAIDLLVMGTVCRTGISGLLIGNTAESVLDQVDCSLLTLKPWGFVSPVVAD